MGINSNDPYLYDDIDVLRNKLGIKNNELLAKKEVDITCLEIHELSKTPLDGNYDFEHLCNFHKKIFGEVYEWAGEPRTVPIHKAEQTLGWQTIDYATPVNIESEATNVLKRMSALDWRKMSIDEKATGLSQSMADLWKVHPFREGNTRTTITFICQFAESRGIVLDRELFEKNASYMRVALVAASANFPDADLRQPEHLFRIVRDSVERGNEIERKNNFTEKQKDLSFDECMKNIRDFKASTEKSSLPGGISKNFNNRGDRD